MLCYLITPIRTSKVRFAKLEERPFHIGFYTVAVGERVAQLIIEKIETPEVLKVDVGPAARSIWIPSNNLVESRRNPSRKRRLWVYWRT